MSDKKQPETEQPRQQNKGWSWGKWIIMIVLGVFPFLSVGFIYLPSLSVGSAYFPSNGPPKNTYGYNYI